MKCPFCDDLEFTFEDDLGQHLCQTHGISEGTARKYVAKVKRQEPASVHAPNGLRDRFAANAPPCPSWFEPDMTRVTAPDEGLSNEAYRRQQLLQWPYAWAQMQLQERAGTVSATVKEDENA